MIRSLTLASIMMAALTLSGGALAASGDVVPRLATAPSAEVIRGSLGADDGAIADWLRDLIEKDLYQYVPRPEDRPAIEAFYRARDFAPVWIRNGVPLPRVREATEFLRDVGADGLDPSNYPTPYFTDRGAYRLAADELVLTNSVLAFARHARTGRVDPARLGGPIQFDLAEPNPADIFARLAGAVDARSALDSLLPQNPEYKALKAALASERLAEGEAHASGGARPRISRINTIIANMERWRWLPRNLGAAYVMVNVPDFTLKIVNRGKTVWSTRIVVGRAGRSSTPLFSQVMTRIMVNRGANPASPVAGNLRGTIATGDAEEPTSSGMDDARAQGAPIRSYQPRGGRSAAGRIRFDIPNKFLVTQSDAPDANLFTKTERIHGRTSMLVEDAERYAQVLLSIARPEDGFTIESIRGLYGDREQIIPFKQLIPVHVTYQTAFNDDSGQLQIRPDIYGYDREMIALLRGDRRVADGPSERKLVPAGKPAATRRPARSTFPFPWD